MDIEKDIDIIYSWQKSVWQFTEDCFNMLPAEPIDSLRGKPITYTGVDGVERTTLLFDDDGRPTYHDLSFYTKKMFKNQGKKSFKSASMSQPRFTWQQTLTLEAYQRALETFDKDSFDIRKRFISVVSGHGTGKTASESVIALHFLICFFGAQIGVTANTENQLKDIFMKEFYWWHKKIPEELGAQVEQLDDKVKVVGEKDWFLRARVASQDKPEALAGLHGEYVLIIVDEASAVHDKVFEVMKGALTGDNYIVIYCSNGTRGEGEFFDSHHSNKRTHTTLAYSSLDSPIVKDSYVEKMAEDYGEDSEEYLIRVKGGFPDTTVMDEKGWIPLFANIQVTYEPEGFQVLTNPLFALDPAGKGRDSSSGMIRDEIYLKEVLHEGTSEAKDLAGKVETIQASYDIPIDDVAVEAFGIGAEVVANLPAGVHALLTDKKSEEQLEKVKEAAPNDGTVLRFNSYKSELAWKFRTWIRNGGIIVTNNKKKWDRQLSKIKYRRNEQGEICLMGKKEFKKTYNFSPDEFDAGIHTMFKPHGTAPKRLSQRERELKETEDFLRKIEALKQKTAENDDGFSSM